MSADEKNVETGAEPGAGGQGPKGETQHPAPHAGGKAFRIGTKDDIRAAGREEEGAGKSAPRVTLRDGT